MIKKETLEILESIEQLFPNFTIDQKRLDSWHFLLKDFDFDKVMDNLKNYALGNEYHPKIKDLVSGLIVNNSYNIPNREETLKIIEGYQIPKEQRMPKDEIERRMKEWKEEHAKHLR